MPAGDKVAHHPLILARCPRCQLIQVLLTAPREDVARTLDRVTVRTRPRVQAAEREAADLMAAATGGPQTVLVAAATDGYRLRPYVESGWSGLGLEPARARGAVGSIAGLRLLPRRFDNDVVDELLEAPIRISVLLLNDLLARAKDPKDVLQAASRLIQDDGVAIARLPDPLACLMADALWAFDHEFLSYFTIRNVRVLAERFGLDVVHVESVAGSVGPELRVTLSHAGAPDRSVLDRLVYEDSHATDAWTTPVTTRLARWRSRTRAWLLEEARAGPIIVLGASRGTSGFLSLVGADPDLVEVVGDLNPFKRDLVVPGTEILIRPLRRLALQDGTGPILIIGPRLARDSTEMQAQFRRAGRPVLLAAP